MSIFRHRDPFIPDAEHIIIENGALTAFRKVIFRQLYDKLPLPQDKTAVRMTGSGQSP